MEGWKQEEEKRRRRKEEEEENTLHMVMKQKRAEGGVPAIWAEREQEDEERGRPWALRNEGFLSPRPPRPPHPPLPPPLREEVGRWKGTEEEKRMDPHQTDARRKRKGKGKERKLKDRKEGAQKYSRGQK